MSALEAEIVSALRSHGMTGVCATDSLQGPPPLRRKFYVVNCAVDERMISQPPQVLLRRGRAIVASVAQIFLTPSREVGDAEAVCIQLVAPGDEQPIRVYSVTIPFSTLRNRSGVQESDIRAIVDSEFSMVEGVSNLL